MKDYLGLGPAEQYEKPTPLTLLVGAVVLVAVGSGFRMLFFDDSFVESLLGAVVIALFAGLFLMVRQIFVARRGSS